MTLIAQLSVNGAPFLVGDVLLSSKHRTGLRVNLPLVGNINEAVASHGLPFAGGELPTEDQPARRSAGGGVVRPDCAGRKGDEGLNVNFISQKFDASVAS